jgi:hypothetical protein
MSWNRVQYTCGCWFATSSTAQCGEVLQSVEESPKAARFAAQSLAQLWKLHLLWCRTRQGCSNVVKAVGFMQSAPLGKV